MAAESDRRRNRSGQERGSLDRNSLYSLNSLYIEMYKPLQPMWVAGVCSVLRY